MSLSLRVPEPTGGVLVQPASGRAVSLPAVRPGGKPLRDAQRAQRGGDRGRAGIQRSECQVFDSLQLLAVTSRVTPTYLERVSLTGRPGEVLLQTG